MQSLPTSLHLLKLWFTIWYRHARCAVAAYTLKTTSWKSTKGPGTIWSSSRASSWTTSPRAWLLHPPCPSCSPSHSRAHTSCSTQTRWVWSRPCASRLTSMTLWTGRPTVSYSWYWYWIFCGRVTLKLTTNSSALDPRSAWHLLNDSQLADYSHSTNWLKSPRVISHKMKL